MPQVIAYLVLLLPILSINWEIAQHHSARRARYWLDGLSLLLAFLALSVLLSPFVPRSDGRSPQVVGAGLLGVVGLAGALAGLALGRSARWRELLRQYLGAHYDPSSALHSLALVYACLASFVSLNNTLSVGGVEGVAQNIAEMPSDLSGFWLNLVLYLSVACCGVGLGIRRSWQASLTRLGLDALNWKQVALGLGYGVALYGFMISAVMLWQSLVDPQIYSQQTQASQALFEQVSRNSSLLWAGLVLALTASVGEEILFRGAVQPVFGVPLTSVFFVFLHVQYAFTPATLILWVVSMVLGWLRWRYNTLTAISAHFIYNFLPFMVLALAEGRL